MPKKDDIGPYEHPGPATLKSRSGNQHPLMTEDAGPYQVGLGPRTFLGESRT